MTMTESEALKAVKEIKLLLSKYGLWYAIENRFRGDTLDMITIDASLKITRDKAMKQ